jgi:hypothetical protein
MDFWEKIKWDVQKGFRDGLAVIREGAVAVKEKAEALTGEGKRQYKLFEIKTKVQKEISELGGRVYGLLVGEKDVSADRRVKSSVTKIKKLETQITKLEAVPAKKSRTVAKTRTGKTATTEERKKEKTGAIKKSAAKTKIITG